MLRLVLLVLFLDVVLRDVVSLEVVFLDVVSLDVVFLDVVFLEFVSLDVVFCDVDVVSHLVPLTLRLFPVV